MHMNLCMYYLNQISGRSWYVCLCVFVFWLKMHAYESMYAVFKSNFWQKLVKYTYAMNIKHFCESLNTINLNSLDVL